MQLIPWRGRSDRTTNDEDHPGIWVTELQFSDGTRLECNRNDVFLVVGPNNGGKSATLRAISSKLKRRAAPSPVVQEISFHKQGSAEEVIVWLENSTKIVRQTYWDKFVLFGNEISRGAVDYHWKNENGQEDLAGFFCTLLDAESRLKAANPPDSIALTTEGPKHPIHFLQWNDSIEQSISSYFERAFGLSIVVHRNAGRTVPIMVGEKPELRAGTDRQSIEYVVNLEKLPVIHTQGDGMRSFLGVLLYSTVAPGSMLLIDEPEAFLHPPQAKHLGNFLVNESDQNRQIFIATHSGDVLRGVLESDSARVRVLRIRRDGEANKVCQLQNGDLSRIWSDPLLRYSNILDGLFHERVVVCESDSDCRFYSAVADAIYDGGQGNEKKPDIMFTHCGGKDRVALALRSLRALGVPLSAVLDFDVLNAEKPLCEIVEAAGGEWKNLRADWLIVFKAIDSLRPQLGVGEVKRDIESALNSVKGHILTDLARKAIQEALRASSPWSTAKSVGIAFVPNGDANQAAVRLLTRLESLGIFVVPVGELEQFVKSIGRHGPSWVASALAKDFLNDPELNAAKDFVGRIVH